MTSEKINFYSFKNHVFISSLMKEDDLRNISKHMFCLVKLRKMFRG
jgi:hypothetical protein